RKYLGLAVLGVIPRIESEE
ncbi:hypothetical protein EVA_18683, partial [gut metagenome]